MPPSGPPGVRQAAVQAVLDRLVTQGPEIGLQVAAYRNGERVVDAWAGVIDRTSRQPVNGQTLFSASSTGKGVAATCVHVLAERGQLDYEAPVCAYWPEFAAHDKHGVTVRQVLSHRAGVPYPPAGFDPTMMVDWQRMCQGIADLPLAFEPGTRTAYHNYTYGYIVGEIVRRIDGRSIARFLRDEICQPLAIDSLYFGVPRAELDRVATREPDSEFNRAEVRQACIPSSGMITNARSLARHYALLAEGGALDGMRLLSEERIRVASELQTDEMDDIYAVRVKRGLGYRLGNDTGPGAGPRALGHVGAAMYGYADPDRHLAIAFVKNYIDPAAGWDVAQAVYASVEQALA
ncbi:MAG TPA: serine hydrolase domain-containing protein [Chloroflexota bacterium]